MKTIYLVDYENVHSSGLEKIHNTIEDEIYVFYTENATKLDLSDYKKNMEPIEVPAGNQSLDRHLISYLGFLIAKNGKKSTYCIVSNDKGYDVIKDFWIDEGYKVKRKSISVTEYHKAIQSKDTPKNNSKIDKKQLSLKIKNTPKVRDSDIKPLDVSKCKLKQCALPNLGRINYLKSKGIDEYEIKSILRLFERYDNNEIDINGVKDVLCSYSWYRDKIDYARHALKTLGYEFEQ